MRKKNPGKGSAPSIEVDQPLVDAWVSTLAALDLRRDNEESRDDVVCAKRVLRKARGDMGQLWRVFTQERKDLSRYLAHAARELTAYFAAMHLPNAARMTLLLSRVERRLSLISAAKRFERLVVYDLGCGTGAAGATVARWFKSGEKKMDLRLVERRKGFLAIARQYCERLQFHDIATYQQDLEAFVKRPPVEEGEVLRIVVLSYVLNELLRYPKVLSQLVRYLRALAKEPCVLLISDAGNQAISRSLMELRNELVASGFKSLYPCPANVACPMLKRSRDWCYSEGEWKRPGPQIYVDELLELDHSSLASSMYAFASPSFLGASVSQFGRVVVGRPRVKSEGRRPDPDKFNYLLCEGERLVKMDSAKIAGESLRRGEALL